MRAKIFSTFVFLSLLWNLYLVIGVVAGKSYALKRAAGGQFEVFPTSIRFIYLINVIFVLFQLFSYLRIIKEEKVVPRRVLKLFVGIGMVGIFLNAASRSPLERWNVMPAIIITFAFYRALKRSSPSK